MNLTPSIVSVTLTLELLTNTLLASQQQACTAVAYVTMQLFGSQAQRAANIQNVMAKHVRVACSTVWDAYMGSAHSKARYISSLDFLSSMPKGVVFFFLSFCLFILYELCRSMTATIVAFYFTALMPCRRRHADVVEWAWFINSYGDDGVYQQLMNGDKDSFLLAFALANKITEYYQVTFLQGWAHASTCCSISSYAKQPSDATAWLRNCLLNLQVTALLLQIRNIRK